MSTTQTVLDLIHLRNTRVDELHSFDREIPTFDMTARCARHAHRIGMLAEIDELDRQIRKLQNLSAPAQAK